MSDPMANMESDAILASIRRLVEATHADRPAQTKIDSPALVLTPSFRVEEDTSAEAAPLILSAEQAVSLPDPEPEPAPEIQEQAATPHEASPIDAAMPTHVVDDVPTESIADAISDALEVSADDWAETLDDTPDALAAQQVASMSLEQRIAELEAAVGAHPSDWEPDGSEDLSAEIPREVPRAFTEAGARVLHFRAPEPQPFVTETVSAPPSFDVDVEEAEVYDDAGLTHDHDVAPDVEAAAPIAPEVQDEAPEVASDVPPDADPVREEFALAGYADDEMFDEEALRDLVAQVIREELQGALGERITRNVRRLVRREVQRALTLRDFD